MNTQPRQVALSEFLTQEEIDLAIELKDVDSIQAQIVKPNIERINHALGQENDPRYLAYAIAFAVSYTIFEKSDSQEVGTQSVGLHGRRK